MPVLELDRVCTLERSWPCAVAGDVAAAGWRVIHILRGQSQQLHQCGKKDFAGVVTARLLTSGCCFGDLLSQPNMSKQKHGFAGPAMRQASAANLDKLHLQCRQSLAACAVSVQRLGRAWQNRLALNITGAVPSTSRSVVQSTDACSRRTTVDYTTVI